VDGLARGWGGCLRPPRPPTGAPGEGPAAVEVNRPGRTLPRTPNKEIRVAVSGVSTVNCQLSTVHCQLSTVQHLSESPREATALPNLAPSPSPRGGLRLSTWQVK
jgi:hypothetical protein